MNNLMDPTTVKAANSRYPKRNILVLLLVGVCYILFRDLMALIKSSDTIETSRGMLIEVEITVHPLSLVYFANDTAFNLFRFQKAVETWQSRINVHYNDKENNNNAHRVLVLITVSAPPASTSFYNDSAVSQAL